MQEEPVRLKRAYKKLITTTTLVTFVLLLGMAAVAEPLVITLVGEKWRTSIFYLQMICLGGMLYPLHALNLNMLNVQGRSDLFLKIEVIKKFVSIPVIILGIFYGIEVMLAGMVINSFVVYFVNSYWSGKLINYSVKEQIFDILPGCGVAALMAGIVYLIGRVLPMGNLPRLMIQVLSGALLVFYFCERSKLESYLYLKAILFNKFALVMNRPS